MPNHIHGIIEIKKNMDVLDRDVRDIVDIHNNVDAYDNVGARNFSPLPHPPSHPSTSTQTIPPSPVQTSLPYPKKMPHMYHVMVQRSPTFAVNLIAKWYGDKSED